MKSEILQSLKTRAALEINGKSSIAFLMNRDFEPVYEVIVSIVYLYTRPKKGDQKVAIYLAEVISALGHSVCQRLKQPKNSAVAARTGAFILYTFEVLGMVQVVLGHGSKGHNSFIIQVLNDELIASLWEKLEITKVEKLPSLTPFTPWTTAKHATGPLMVKTQNKEVLNALTAETHPIVFDCINKAQEMGWTINNQLFPIAVWALRNKTQAFAEIWELTNAEAKATKLREAKSIINIAKRFLNLTFYHLYYFDFRGRKYPTTAYLHEQGSDLARGLIKRSCAPEPIGFEGFRWLMIVIASNWAGTSDRPDKAKTDKIPMEERFKWAKAHEETFLGYAENPRSNDGWMKADKPWQFLAACIELFSMRVWQAERGDFDNYDYPSCFEGYFDGSNNGSQHLAALTRDEVTAPHVNLVPLDLPGDLYKYVGDHVWERLVEVTSQYTEDELAACNRFIDAAVSLKRKITAAPAKSEERAALVSELKQLREAESETAKICSPVFWLRIVDAKERRKVVKR